MCHMDALLCCFLRHSVAQPHGSRTGRVRELLGHHAALHISAAARTPDVRHGFSLWNTVAQLCGMRSLGTFFGCSCCGRTSGLLPYVHPRATSKHASSAMASLCGMVENHSIWFQCLLSTLTQIFVAFILTQIFVAFILTQIFVAFIRFTSQAKLSQYKPSKAFTIQAKQSFRIQAKVYKPILKQSLNTSVGKS